MMQLKAWLSEHGMETDSLGKKAVVSMLKDAPADLRKVLELRLQLSKSSVKKYTAMQETLCADGRARVCFSFMGPIASAAGRDVTSNCRTCPRTTCQTWKKPALL